MWTDLFEKIGTVYDMGKAQDVLHTLNTSTDKGEHRHHPMGNKEIMDIDKLVAVADNLVEKALGEHTEGKRYYILLGILPIC